MENSLCFLKAEVERAKIDLDVAVEKKEDVDQKFSIYVSRLEKYAEAMEEVLSDFNML